MTNAESQKKLALQEYKQKILNDLKYVDERINEARNKPKKIFEGCDSSEESDFDLSKSVDLGPSVSALKLDQKRFKTCLQATQELTSVQVLESETTLLVEEPTVDGPPVTESGNWYEVMAECRLDLVPFLITFLVHRSSRKFGPVHYRNLKVTPVKKAHENELTSGLVSLSRPADAIEIIKQYAEEHRSRRNTLARLADTFAGALRMAPMPDGGYTLQCVDVLEILWIIKYSRSRARFQHALKFDIDHLDENYIIVIKNAYAQLNNTRTTEKRTALLEEIIRTCIEATGKTDFGESTDQSDHEVIEKLIPQPNLIGRNNKKDSEIMAPPKTLPKKTKSKGKENKDRNAANEEKDEIPPKRSKKDSPVDVNSKTVDVAKSKEIKENTKQKETSTIVKEVGQKTGLETQSKVKQNVQEKKKKNISPVNEKSDINKENEQSKKTNSENEIKDKKQEKNMKKSVPVNDKSKNKNEIIKTIDDTKKSAEIVNKDTQKVLVQKDNTKKSDAQNVPVKNKTKVTAVPAKQIKNGDEKLTKPTEIITYKQNQNNNVKASSEDKNKKATTKDKETTSTEKTAKNVAKPVSKIPKFKPSSTKDSNDSKASSIKNSLSKIPNKNIEIQKRIMSPRSRNLVDFNNKNPVNNKHKIPDSVKNTKTVSSKEVVSDKLVEKQIRSGSKRKLSIVDRVIALETKRKSITNLKTMKNQSVNSVTKNKVSKFT